MTAKPNTTWYSMNDSALIEQIGYTVRRKRLAQNKTQAQVASDAGINRWTLSQLENGESVNLTSLIQILRVLELLDFMESFVVDDTMSPIEYAKLKEKERKRARGIVAEPDPDEDLTW